MVASSPRSIWDTRPGDTPGHPRNVYLREDDFGREVNGWIADVFAPGRIQHTIGLIMAAQDTTTSSDAAEAAAGAAAGAKIADTRQRMARYKQAIEAGGDPAEIGAWISQARAQRVQAEAELRQASTKARSTTDEIEALIASLTDIAATLGDGDPAHMADAYDKIGLRLIYHPDPQVLHAIAQPDMGNIGKWSVSEVRLHRIANVSWLRGSRLAELSSAHAPVQADLQRADARTANP
jgi:hypothetical protein